MSTYALHNINIEPFDVDTIIEVEIKFNSQKIQITAKDEETYIRIFDKKGIEIYL